MPLTLKRKRLMENDVVVLDGNRTAKEALRSMLENGVWSVVVSLGGLPSGVVTERFVKKSNR